MWSGTRIRSEAGPPLVFSITWNPLRHLQNKIQGDSGTAGFVDHQPHAYPRVVRATCYWCGVFCSDCSPRPAPAGRKTARITGSRRERCFFSFWFPLWTYVPIPDDWTLITDHDIPKLLMHIQPFQGLDLQNFPGRARPRRPWVYERLHMCLSPFLEKALHGPWCTNIDREKAECWRKTSKVLSIRNVLKQGKRRCWQSATPSWLTWPEMFAFYEDITRPSHLGGSRKQTTANIQMDPQKELQWSFKHLCPQESARKGKIWRQSQKPAHASILLV